jgi:hypothetical protein
MNVSDLDSIVHLLQSISIWGIAFIILIILPLYTLGWSAVFKLLSLNTRQSYTFVIIIVVSIIISITLLKIGIIEDQKLNTSAIKIKNYIISTYFNYADFQHLKSSNIANDSAIIDRLITRYPESFTYSWLDNKSMLLLIDTVSLRQLNKAIDRFIPIAYSELSSVLKKDSILTFVHIMNRIDTRISYMVLEKLISKYPKEFIEIGNVDPATYFEFSSIKRIK